MLHQKPLLPKARHLVQPQGKQEMLWAKALCWVRGFLRRLNLASALAQHLLPLVRKLSAAQLHHLPRLRVRARLLLV
jgi:hypothetical protein